MGTEMGWFGRRFRILLEYRGNLVQIDRRCEDRREAVADHNPLRRRGDRQLQHGLRRRRCTSAGGTVPIRSLWLRYSPSTRTITSSMRALGCARTSSATGAEPSSGCGLAAGCIAASALCHLVAAWTAFKHHGQSGWMADDRRDMPTFSVGPALKHFTRHVRPDSLRSRPLGRCQG